MSNNLFLLSQLKKLGYSLLKPFEPLFISSCALCFADSKQAPVCQSCRNDLPFFNPTQCCIRCAKPLLVTSLPGNLCAQCLYTPPLFDRAFARFYYQFPVNQLIKAMKYHGRLDLAVFFANECVQLKNQLVHLGADCVIPLPLSRERLAERGFNQSQLLAQPLAKTLMLPLEKVFLLRSRHGPAQTGLSFRARRRNLVGSFTCTEKLDGRRIILVDDVLTSGSTLNEATRVLKRQGAKQVFTVVLARRI